MKKTKDVPFRPIKRWMLVDSNGHTEPSEFTYLDRLEAVAAIDAHHSEEGSIMYRPVRVSIVPVPKKRKRK